MKNPVGDYYLIKKVNRLSKMYARLQPMSSPHNKTYWPYQHTVDYDKIKGAERWCYNHFETKKWRNAVQFFAFKNKKDLVLFLLRWA